MSTTTESKILCACTYLKTGGIVVDWRNRGAFLNEMSGEQNSISAALRVGVFNKQPNKYIYIHTYIHTQTYWDMQSKHYVTYYMLCNTYIHTTKNVSCIPIIIVYATEEVEEDMVQHTHTHTQPDCSWLRLLLYGDGATLQRKWPHAGLNKLGQTYCCTLYAIKCTNTYIRGLWRTEIWTQ